MANLKQIGSKAQDLYFQDYPDRSDFFDIDDFKYHCATLYSKMLNDLYQKVRRENKQEMGFSSVDIDPQWMITEEFTETKYDENKKRHFLKLGQDVFAFDFDAFGNGFNSVRGYSGQQLKKISINEANFLDVIPNTPNIYYHLEGKNNIVFCCDPKGLLTATYLPAVSGSDDNCVIADTMVSELISGTLRLMFGAKTGNVIDESNDGNRNNILQQQTNPSLNKVQQ